MTACAGGYRLVTPGTVEAGGLRLEADSGWVSIPGDNTPWTRRDTRVWTRNGITLDRLVIITAVPDGEPIYVARDDRAYPVFSTEMSADDLRTLVARTIELAQGANLTEVNISNARPHRFGSSSGELFDLAATVLDGPEYRGLAGTFVARERLYVLYFLGAVPYYYEEGVASAEAVIRSAGR